MTMHFRSPGDYWAVVRTHPRKEDLALRALEAQGFRVFCPMTWTTVRRSRRVHDRQVPLFRGYVFAALEIGARAWRPIGSTMGVQYLLTGEDGRPSRLPTEFVRELLAHTSGEGVFSPRLVPGQHARVRKGPFADLVGRIETLDETGRASLMLELMSRQVRVSVEGRDLEGVG